MRKSLLMSTLFASAAAFGATDTFEWNSDTTFPNDYFYTSGTNYAEKTRVNDLDVNINTNVSLGSFMFQSSGSKNGNLTVNTTGENILTFTGNTFFNWNAGPALNTRYEAFDVSLGSGISFLMRMSQQPRNRIFWLRTKRRRPTAPSTSSSAKIPMLPPKAPSN